MRDRAVPLTPTLYPLGRGRAPRSGRVRGIIDFIAAKTSSTIESPFEMTALPGGGVLRHFLLAFDPTGGRFPGPQRWVLRADGLTKLGIGLPRAQEFTLQRLLFRAGLKVAEPLFMCCDESVFGAPFFLMRFLPGEADGATLVARGPNEPLAETLGCELAKLHGLDLARALQFLPAPPEDAAVARIAELERHLAADCDPHP